MTRVLVLASIARCFTEQYDVTMNTILLSCLALIVRFHFNIQKFVYVRWYILL